MCSVVKTGRSAVVKTGEIAVISNLVPNIQLADIAASTLCRALNGHLQPSGWEPAAQLLIREKEAPFMQIGKAAGKRARRRTSCRYGLAKIGFLGVRLWCWRPRCSEILILLTHKSANTEMYWAKAPVYSSCPVALSACAMVASGRSRVRGASFNGTAP